MQCFKLCEDVRRKKGGRIWPTAMFYPGHQVGPISFAIDNFDEMVLYLLSSIIGMGDGGVRVNY